MTSPVFNIRQIYNFDMYAPALLGASYKSVTVLAVMDRETAARDIDPQALHVQVFPYLPAGTPNDPNGYDYVKIKTPAGNTTVVGIPWIKADTIVSVESRTITVQIANVNAGDVPRVRDALVQNGFNAVTLSISS